MIDGMLAEPWHFTGHQERRLREFLHLLSGYSGTKSAQVTLAI